MGNSSGKPIVLTDEVNLNHFRLLRVVGKGAFGKVRIVERKDTGLTFALKYIRKDEVVRSESVRNIIRERRMLEHLNHPFLCNLRYLVVDLMNGGDLRFHITRKTFTEEAVRFWIAELGCALKYIHKQGVVHRDVKPDNVLLDSEGHVHLADFNVASDLTPGKPLTSRSGTLAYLAPEVYAGKGYGSEVDWWSLGVLFYECIYNKRPFEANNQEALAQTIRAGNAPFPVTNPPVSMPCLHAISSLLEKNRSLRIGASGFETFTDNPFFRPIDFEALERKEIEPVFCPSSEKTNFDATYDLEELLLEEAPLEARARKQKPRAELREDATRQEIRADELYRMIETYFEPFNYTQMPDYRPPVTESTIAGTSRPGSGHDKGEGEWPLPNKPAGAQAIPRSAPSTKPPSSSHSPDGSPPLQVPGHRGRNSPAVDRQPSPAPPTSQPYTALPPLKTGPNGQIDSRSSPTSPSSIVAANKKYGSTRSTSQAGGVQVVLNEEGSWSDMANQSRSLVTDDKQKSSGMLGFLNRKKGRDRSPKTKDKERGVLGKEGARVVISHG